MIVILLGAPGAGKGTQGARVVEKYKLPKISTGEIFRDLAAAGTPLGLEAKTFWTQGKLVPDEIVVGLVRERISQDDCVNGFILDGFPRTVHQASILDNLLDECKTQVDAVLDFVVDEAELIRRLSGRRSCSHCGATYHVTSMPSRVDGVCDHCGSKLEQRADDTPDSIRTRLQEYENKTAPVRGYYEGRALLKRVDANDQPDAIFNRVEEALRDVA